MFGIIMPSRTATPQDARPRSARLPATKRPSFSSASIAGNDRMITSVFSPPTKRSLCAPTVLKCEFDLVAARAGELRREFAHRPLDRARAHDFDLGHSNSFSSWE